MGKIKCYFVTVKFINKSKCSISLIQLFFGTHSSLAKSTGNPMDYIEQEVFQNTHPQKNKLFMQSWHLRRGTILKTTHRILYQLTIKKIFLKILGLNYASGDGAERIFKELYRLQRFKSALNQSTHTISGKTKGRETCRKKIMFSVLRYTVTYFQTDC